MDWNRVAVNWTQIKNRVKAEWIRLSEDDLDVIAGSRDRLIRQLARTYGFSRDDAERRVRYWENRFEPEQRTSHE